jgi:hypothetical protein
MGQAVEQRRCDAITSEWLAAFMHDPLLSNHCAIHSADVIYVLDRMDDVGLPFKRSPVSNRAYDRALRDGVAAVRFGNGMPI